MENGAADIKIELEQLSPLLASLQKNLPYALPDPTYFDHFSCSLAENISLTPDADKEVTDVSSTLLGMDKKNVYYVPDGYWDEFQKNVRKKTHSSGIVVGMKSRLVRYSIAAALLGALLITGIRLLVEMNSTEIVKEQPPILNDAAYQQLLVSIDDESIIRFLEETGMHLDRNELEQYLETEVLPNEAEYYLDTEFPESP